MKKFQVLQQGFDGDNQVGELLTNKKEAELVAKNYQKSSGDICRVEEIND